MYQYTNTKVPTDLNRRNLSGPSARETAPRVSRPPKPLTVESDEDSAGSASQGCARNELQLPDITSSLNVVDPNRVEGKRQTSVDVGDVMQLKYKKEQGTYKGKVLKFFRSKVTRSTKRDANGKVISIKMNGGDLMMSVEWIDAPACTGGSVIGHTQELQVTDFLRDYKVQQISYVSKK